MLMELGSHALRQLAAEYLDQFLRLLLFIRGPHERGVTLFDKGHAWPILLGRTTGQQCRAPHTMPAPYSNGIHQYDICFIVVPWLLLHLFCKHVCQTCSMMMTDASNAAKNHTFWCPYGMISSWQKGGP